MAYDERLAARVRRVLAGREDLVEKKMMGGLCFMLQGGMCCALSGAGLMVRIGREAYERTLAEPHVRAMELAGRRLGGFVLIEPAGYRGDAALAAWIGRGVDFVATLPAKKPRATGGRRKRRAPAAL